jgi:dTDP-4-amino-4,6-dideoxygalactose transaminase
MVPASHQEDDVEMVQTAERLALEGGAKTVTVPPGDRWQRISDAEVEAVVAAMRGPNVYAATPQFEQEFATFVGAKHAVALCNGTATIHSALFAAGVRAGDEVIVPSYTWHASITPIVHCGGTPVFCEVDPDTYTADAEDVRRRITPRTKVVVVTHVLGNPAQMDAILAVTRPRGIRVIEDASHAHGGAYDGKPVGTIGDIGCFSLQASKAMSAVEGGVATTDDTDLFERMVILGRYGTIQQMLVTDRYRDVHDIGLGIKYRPNPLGMAMARVQLQRLPELNAKRRAWFAHLDAELERLPGIVPQRVYPRAQRGGLLLYAGKIVPDELGVPLATFRKALAAEGVPMTPGITPFGYGKMHAEPVFTDFSFEDLGGPWGSPNGDPRRPQPRGSLPVTEALADQVFWLTTPVDPDPRWLDQIVAAFRKVIDQAPHLARLAA